MKKSSLAHYLLSKGCTEKDLNYIKNFNEAEEYRHFSINQNGKKRKINKPSDKLKKIQKVLIGLWGQVSQHPAAFGINSKSAIENANQHKGKIILKMDIKNFFPNTNLHTLRWVLASQSLETNLASQLREAEPLCFIFDKGRHMWKLPTGAPTSPIISSLTFKIADEKLSTLSKENNLTYTRYVDDLTFSGNQYPPGFQKEVSKIVRGSGYVLNHKKSQLLFLGNDSQIVTGVCVNEKNNVSKSFRRSLRAELDLYAKNHLPLDSRMNGKINYVEQLNREQAIYFRKYFKKRQERWR